MDIDSFHLNRKKAVLRGENRLWHMNGRRVKGGAGQLESLQSVGQTLCQSQVTQTGLGSERRGTVTLYLQPAHWRRSRTLNSLLQTSLPCFYTCINGHILLNTCSCLFVCFWVGRWPLYCIISPATTLHFAISSCFCVIAANIDFREGDGCACLSLSAAASKGQWLSNVPIKKNNAVFHWSALGVAAGHWESAAKKHQMHLLLDKTDWPDWALRAPKDKIKPLLLCFGASFIVFFSDWAVCALVAVPHVHIELNSVLPEVKIPFIFCIRIFYY